MSYHYRVNLVDFCALLKLTFEVKYIEYIEINLTFEVSIYTLFNLVSKVGSLVEVSLEPL